MKPPISDTRDPAYARRLQALEGAWWKRLLDVQRPFRWNLARLEPGLMLEVGCGIGRNLANLAAVGGRGVGVDHNAESVAVARARGLEALTSDDFAASPWARPGTFDSLLLAHVVEHLVPDEAIAIVRGYLRWVRPGGKLLLITPQEAGQRSDPTHVAFADFAALDRLATALGLRLLRRYSFPFPRPVGHLFRYNEFVAVYALPTTTPAESVD